jgi:glycogen(starch) synthase
MKVLMLGWEFPPQITGGLGTACYGITKSLAKQNINVLLVVPKTFGNEDRSFATIQDAGDIPSKYLESNSNEFWKKVFYKEISAKLIPYTTPEDYKKKMEKNVYMSGFVTNYDNPDFAPFTGSYGSDLWSEIKRYSIVTSLLAVRETYDIIHAHEWLTFPAAISAKKISGKPLIVHIHATEFDRNSGNVDRDIYDIEKKGMEFSDRVITVSDYTKNIVIKNYGINPEKVITIHNGIEKAANFSRLKFQKVPGEKIVTFLGRITHQKGPEYFVEAAFRVLQKHNNVRFVIAGSGDLKDKIVTMVNDLNIEKKVSFTGFLKNDEVRKLLARSDLFVMPSVSEPFGISPLEALQSRVPIIISKQSGVSEVINNAIKVDYWDINALSDAINGVLNYKTLSGLLSSNGSREVKKLGWEKTGRQISNLYKSIA